MRNDIWDPSCPDGALRHGPADGAGRCPWCGTKYQDALPAPSRYPRSELSEAYEEHFDSDYGAKGRIERERESHAGTTYY